MSSASGSTSNLTKFVRVKRLSDNVDIAINLTFVRAIMPIAGGARLVFGATGNNAVDFLDVKATLAQIRKMVDIQL